MKKFLTLLVVLIALMFCFAACAPGVPDAPVAPDDESSLISDVKFDRDNLSEKDILHLTASFPVPMAGDEPKFFRRGFVSVEENGYEGCDLLNVVWDGEFADGPVFVKDNTYTVTVEFYNSLLSEYYSKKIWPQFEYDLREGYTVIKDVKFADDGDYSTLTLEVTVGTYDDLKSDECDHKVEFTDEYGSPYDDGNCQREGYIIHTCECGYKREFESLGFGEHNWKLDLECEDLDIDFRTYAATCTEDGLEVKVCTVCLATQETVIPAKGHNYISDPSKYVKPTCTKPGKDVSVCEYCKDEKVESIKAKGHVFKTTNWEIIKDATCTEAEVVGNKCSVCHEIVLKNVGKPLGHVPGCDPIDGNYEYHLVVCDRCFIELGKEKHTPDENNRCSKCWMNLQIN